MTEAIGVIVGILALILSIIALIQTRRSNHLAEKANEMSATANSVAEEATNFAGRALKLQEEEGELKLRVKPRMMQIIGEGEDPRPRPVVEVINLSAFPVTITGVHWKTGEKWLFWKTPNASAPYGHLPARLPPREAVTVFGVPTSFESVEQLISITAAVAVTACGEQVSGMTEDWQDYCKKVRERGSMHSSEVTDERR